MYTPEEISKLTIGLDDEFRFKCRACGKCCKNRDDILLTPRDLFNVAMKLHKHNREVVTEYCELFVGHVSGIPIVRLMPRGKDNACPFFSGKLCQVNDMKPIVCALFPLGRVRTHDDQDAMQPGKSPPTEYILQQTGCGSTNQKQTVRRWLERYRIPINDHFDDLWNGTVFRLSTYMQGRDKMEADQYRQLINTVAALLYFHYDMSEAFLPQFERNVALLTDAMR